MKQPQLLSLQNMFDKLTGDNSNRIISKNGFIIGYEMNRLFRPFITTAGSPYLLEDYRLGIVKKGFIHSILNLQEFRVGEGDAVFITPGSIVEPIEMSDDFQVTGIGITSDLFHLIHPGKLPDLFSGKTKSGVMALNPEQRSMLDMMFRTLWTMANLHSDGNGDDKEHGGVSQQTMGRLVTCITSYYNDIFGSRQPGSSAQPAANAIFDRFIYLVNNNCREQRHLSFYADKICITERYLGTVVRQTSGITAKEWIDKAVITAAKVMLRHTNLQVAEITERLHFPNPSFFCKYFRRIEGCTPQEYREK